MLGGELIRGNYTQGGFARIPIQNSFYMSCFLFSVSILYVELLRVIAQGKFSPGLTFLEDVPVGRVFLCGDKPDFLGLFKKRSEIKYKRQVFSAESKEQH